MEKFAPVPVRIEVRSDAGEPIPGARVDLLAESADGVRTYLAAADSAGDGIATVAIDRVPVSIVARSGGHVGARTAIGHQADLHPGEPHRLVLRRLGTIRVRARDVGGGPVPGARIAYEYGLDAELIDALPLFLDSEGPRLRFNEVTTDLDGDVLVSGLFPGTPIRVSATQQSSGASEPQSLTLSPGELRAVDLVLQRKFTLQARIADPTGNPVVGARVASFDVRGTDLIGSTWTNSRAGGEVLLAGMRGGRHKIAISGWNESYSALYLYDVAVEGREGQELDLGSLRPVGEMATLRIDVEDDRDGARRASIQLWNSATPGGLPSTTFETIAPTGRDFAVYGLSPGSWAYSASALRIGSDTRPDPLFSPTTSQQDGTEEIVVPSGSTTTLKIRRRVKPDPATQPRALNVHVTPQSGNGNAGSVDVAVFTPQGELLGFAKGFSSREPFAAPFAIPADGEVWVMARGAIMSGRARVTLGAAQERTGAAIEMNGVAPRIAGQLVWRDSMEPVGQASYSISTVGGGATTQPRGLSSEPILTGRSDPTGKIDVSAYPLVPLLVRVRTDAGASGKMNLGALSEGGRSASLRELERDN